jgi:hypothetical protein
MAAIKHLHNGPKTKGSMIKGTNPKNYLTTNAISNNVAGSMGKATNAMSKSAVGGPVFQKSGKRGFGAS